MPRIDTWTHGTCQEAERQTRSWQVTGQHSGQQGEEASFSHQRGDERLAYSHRKKPHPRFTYTSRPGGSYIYA